MGGVSFGATRGMMPGRWLDLAVVNHSANLPGTEATQAIPARPEHGPQPDAVAGQGASRAAKPARDSVDEVPEQPKGRILFYWGCSDTVRPGQPRILDFAKAGVEDYGKFMMGRAVRDTGAKADSRARHLAQRNSTARKCRPMPP